MDSMTRAAVGGDTVKNSKRELLLSALLTHATVREAAASVNIPETTAYNHLRDPEFNEEYRQRKRQAVAEASDFLQSRLNEAAQAVRSLMNNEKVSPRTRLDAARTLLEYGYKAFTDTEILQRIEQLEQSMDDNGR